MLPNLMSVSHFVTNRQLLGKAWVKPNRCLKQFCQICTEKLSKLHILKLITKSLPGRMYNLDFERALNYIPEPGLQILCTYQIASTLILDT